LIPLPETSEKLSIQPTTTLGMLCSIIKLAQGGVLPKWLHGSSETYIVASFKTLLSFTEFIALTSACACPAL
jgi:hypothetical protein